jgi:hypothetical protein
MLLCQRARRVVGLALSSGIGRILLTLFIGLQVTVRVALSAPDMDHAAGRLDKSSFANVMAGFLLVDH